MADAIPNNLPLQLSSFIGREREIAELKQRLASSRLVTLTGAGGCGKTRLAIEVAQDLTGFGNLSGLFADGVWLVELASLSDPSLVPQIVANTLDVREQPNQSILTTLTNVLRDKYLLLLLDNCEHLIDACAQLSESLLQACPHLRILATSREALRIAGEMSSFVPSLAAPDPQHLPPLDRLTQYESVRLFVERATAAHAHFELTDKNSNAIVQICRRLDGIPLAIELAAARVTTLSLEQIATRLDDVFHVLTGGSRTTLPRHQTLRATMDWSYDLLSEPERILFRRLSVFAGGWILDAAEAVCADGNGTTQQLAASDVVDVLSQLVNKSLVIAEEREDETRYRMLETIRQYARKKLSQAGETNHLSNRHLDFFVKIAEDVEPKLRGPEQLAWFDRLEIEHDNLRAVMQWSLIEGDILAGLRTAVALTWFWWARGYWSEGRERLLQMLARSETVVRRSQFLQARAKAFQTAGILSVAMGDSVGAQSALRTSIALAHEWGQESKPLLALSLTVLAFDTIAQDLTAAQALSEESLANARVAGNAWVLARSLNTRGLIAMFQEDYAAARAFLAESIEIFRAVGDRLASAAPLSNLGRVTQRQGLIFTQNVCVMAK